MSRNTAGTSSDQEAATAGLDPLLAVDEEITLTMRADETKKLIETAFGDEPFDVPCLDDEITIDRPTPVSMPPSSPRLPALKMLAIAPPHPHVTPALARAARELLQAEDVARRGLAQQRKNQIWLVAGIWAMALSLVVMLALIVNNA
jgi:hypothetical protein